MEKKLGLYIHIPFCERKCLYCDFLSSSNKEDKARYLEALKNEITSCKNEYENYHVDTVYIGGGTPSLLNTDELWAIYDSAAGTFGLENDAEITMEMNPGTNTNVPGFVNRVSLGVQSFDDKMLRVMGRIHDAKTALSSISKVREQVENVSLDLMFGLPGQSPESFFSDIETALSTGIKHLSIYSLTLEEGTPFFETYGPGGPEQDLLPDEETEREMYHGAVRMLEDAGFKKYEISNFAIPGYESRHNSRYWKRQYYLGLGLGASSFVGNKRFANVSDMDEYIDGMAKAEEEITDTAAMEETMFLGLRMSEGVSVEEFKKAFKVSLDDIYGNEIERHIRDGLMKREDGRVFLTDRGTDISNHVLSSFIRG